MAKFTWVKKERRVLLGSITTTVGVSKLLVVLMFVL
jgi:hypothetical protein